MASKKVGPSAARRVKQAWKKSGSRASLKAWLRQAPNDVVELAGQWRANKGANTKAPPKKIGRTRMRVKSGGPPKAQKKA